MWLKKADAAIKRHGPEKLRYTRYYEHDGALRAYANRAMLFSLLCIPLALLSLGLAAYVRLQPPTVIRVDANGTASLVGKTATTSPTQQVASRAVNSDPSEFEKRAYAGLFLKQYLNFSYESVDRSWADALNMMTANLRSATLALIHKRNLIADIQEDQITCVFHLRSLEPAKDDPLSFVAFGIKEVHRVRDHKETTDKLIGEFHLRLITERRSEQNPSGLLIAEYGEKLIEGERRDTSASEAAFRRSN